MANLVNFVCPVCEGGSRADGKIHRPVSLASEVCKVVMEYIVRMRTTMSLEENDLFASTQHSFHPRRSCITQLQQLSHSNVVVIYLDFVMIFDKVDHGRVCHQLPDLGITGKVGVRVHDFLNDKSQAVATNGALCGETSRNFTGTCTTILMWLSQTYPQPCTAAS